MQVLGADLGLFIVGIMIGLFLLSDCDCYSVYSIAYMA